jgi:Transposase
MKRSKFTEAQIAFILRQAEEGTAVGEVCRKAGISEATYYNWRKKYAGLMPNPRRRPIATNKPSTSAAGDRPLPHTAPHKLPAQVEHPAAGRSRMLVAVHGLALR